MVDQEKPKDYKGKHAGKGKHSGKNKEKGTVYGVNRKHLEKGKKVTKLTDREHEDEN